MGRLTPALGLVLALAWGTGCSSSGGLNFADLWWTPDQQGRQAFENGDYAQAARLFEDSMWRGTAFYLDQDFESALESFARIDSAEGWFNRGNALAHLERYEEASDAYRRALELRRDYPEAVANLDYLVPFQPREPQGGEMGTIGRDAEADEIVFDADKTRLDEEGLDTVVAGDQGVMTDEQLAEVWLRQVDTSPTAFLRYKFAYQEATKGASKVGTP